jgi:hypothetical protein
MATVKGVACPSPTSGTDQEAKVRALLVNLGYEQLYGTNDTDIRRNLRISGKVADFVGYNSKTGRWLVAESKGGHLDDAVAQISNTVDGLLIKTPSTLGKIDLAIFMNLVQYNKLTLLGIGGWQVDVNNYLGYIDQINNTGWKYQEKNGVRIKIELAPS